MAVMVIWLVIIAVLVALAVGWYVKRAREGLVWDESTQRAAVGLHACRRRLELAHLKSEIRRDSAAARRQIRKELDSTRETGRE